MGSPAVWSFTTRPVSLGITWNMISVSADLGEGATIAEALAPIAGQYALVYAYAGCTDPQNPWRTFNPANPAASDLELHDPMLGYWVFVTQSTHLASEGDPYASLAVDLCAGWNLVGVPYAEPVPVSQATAACSDSVKMVYTFDLAAEDGPWLKHKPGAAISNDFENFEPGKGYWVYSTGACTLGGSE
jgi:hypothetical protein